MKNALDRRRLQADDQPSEHRLTEYEVVVTGAPPAPEARDTALTGDFAALVDARLLVLQRTIPGYRIEFFRQLAERVAQLHVASADPTDPFGDGSVQWVPGCLRGTGRVALQMVSLRELRAAQVIVVELNPRLLTAWAIALGCRLSRRRQSVLWGHREGRRGGKGRLRAVLEGLADVVVYYTEAEVRRESVNGSGGVRFSAPNTLDVKYLRGERRRDGVVLSCRLVPEKDPLLAVEAVAAMLPPLPTLHVVGDGPLGGAVRERANRLGVPIVLHGAVSYAADAAAPIYARAFAALSPGYVGLNLNQAALSGVPLIYRADARHAPEVSFAHAANSVPVRGVEPQEWACALDQVRERWSVDEADRLAAESARDLGMSRMVDGMVGAVRAAAENLPVDRGSIRNVLRSLRRAKRRLGREGRGPDMSGAGER
jgi:glycosyltransferase involved in cell wall biosynthesis